MTTQPFFNKFTFITQQCKWTEQCSIFNTIEDGTLLCPFTLFILDS